MHFIKEIYILLVIIILGVNFSCGNNLSVSREKPIRNDVKVDCKINGGNILSTFRLTGNGTESFDMPENTNADWISLSPIIEIQRDNKGDLFFDSKKAKNIPKIINNIRDKGANNFMLKPLISFKLLGFNFWGDYFANSEEEWLQVEKSYKRLLVSYADISKDNCEIKILCIGNELSEFTKQRPNFFRNISILIKNKYPNLKLTYASNWDEYNHIEFWDVLDYIGVNSYFPLVNKSTPDISEIEIAYKPIKDDLFSLSSKFNKPILFTEYGFRSIDHATWKIWKLPDFLTSRSTYNPEVQKNGYTAFYNTFWQEKWVVGGFFWVWEIVPQADIKLNNQATYLNSDWSINYKPVLEVVKNAYSN